MAIKVFTSRHCQPCQEVDKLIKEGKFQGEVELIDIESDDGFQKFKDEVLSLGDGAVPSAYKDGKKCIIRITEDDSLVFNCPIDTPSTGQG